MKIIIRDKMSDDINPRAWAGSYPRSESGKLFQYDSWSWCLGWAISDCWFWESDYFCAKNYGLGAS